MHLIKDDRSLVNFFSYKTIILESYRLSPIYKRCIGFLSKIKIFKVYKNNLCMGTQKYIMKMLKELLVSSRDMLGLFNLPMVNQL